jgi:uracil DNA glycosylase
MSYTVVVLGQQDLTLPYSRTNLVFQECRRVFKKISFPSSIVAIFENLKPNVRKRVIIKLLNN